MRVCLGGTFDRLHVGHETLLARAFELGDEVFIGLTSQRLALQSRGRPVRPYKTRLRELEALLRRRGWKATVAEIDTPFGRSIEPRYDAIVVSPETLPRTLEINRERRRLRLRPLKVFTIPFLYSDDGLRISASRIAAGEIDARGHRLKPVLVAVGSANRLKVRAVEAAFHLAFPKLRFRMRGFKVSSGVPEQPYGAQTSEGARNRALRAIAAWPAADYGVGIEAGLLKDPGLKRWVDVQYVAAVDKQGGWSAGHGGAFYYPDTVTAAVRKGRTISDVVGPLAGDPRVGSTTGAIGFLTRGVLDREQLTAQGVLLALVPRIARDLYQE